MRSRSIPTMLSAREGQPMVLASIGAASKLARPHPWPVRTPAAGSAYTRQSMNSGHYR